MKSSLMFLFVMSCSLLGIEPKHGYDATCLVSIGKEEIDRQEKLVKEIIKAELLREKNIEAIKKSQEKAEELLARYPHPTATIYAAGGTAFIVFTGCALVYKVLFMNNR